MDILKTGEDSCAGHKTKSDEALLKENLFPFSSIREEQRRMLEDVSKNVDQGGALLANAPTGIGKTAASLPPALAYGIKNGKTVFFLTPKHSQHHIVVETLKKIRDRYGRNIVSIDVIGKQWTCLFEGAIELGHTEFTAFCQAHKRNETCRFHNKVYDPVRKDVTKEARAVVDEIRKKSPLHAEEILEICHKAEMCPYEISVLAGRSAQVVICDYYHLFHNHVRKALLSKMNKRLEDSILIVDEAHNLPERIRSLMSSNLTEYTLSNALKEARGLRDESAESDIETIALILKNLIKDTKSAKGREVFVKKGELLSELAKETKLDIGSLVEGLEAFGERVLEFPNRYRSYAMSVASFLHDWDEKDETAHARILSTYSSQAGTKRFQIAVKCLDPAAYSSEVFSQAHASILMSGTLLPLEMYEAVLGLKKAVMEQYRNPFPPENRLVVLTHGITTKYTKRDEYMWNKISVILSRIISNVPGNVAVFFPSYDILKRINSMVRISRKEVLVEKQEMNKSQRHELYKRLAYLSNANTGTGRVDEGPGGVLLAVQAGSFSEGMDFPGRMLDCVVVVGLPLEKPTLETEALINYYDFKFGRGWEFGYIFPAMNKSLQAAGRCIRSETDRGAIVLMDERFNWQNYRKCFPKDMKTVLTERPEEQVARFFSATG